MAAAHLLPRLRGSSVAVASSAPPRAARVVVWLQTSCLNPWAPLGFLFSSFFSFLQNFVNELWVDFGSETNRVAQQESGRIEVLRSLRAQSGSTLLPYVLALSSACSMGELISSRVSLSRQTQWFYQSHPIPRR